MARSEVDVRLANVLLPMPISRVTFVIIIVIETLASLMVISRVAFIHRQKDSFLVPENESGGKNSSSLF